MIESALPEFGQWMGLVLLATEQEACLEIEESSYKKIKRILVSHYSEPNKNAVREIKERKGYWIKR